MTKKYLSDIIGDEYKAWNKEQVILDCGTGRGKTHFVLNKLCLHALKEGKFVLYLCNRNKLKEQIENDVNKNNLYNVTVMNYQKLQQDINNKTHDKTKYDYIIADEVHYIFMDSSFNYYTDIIYEYLTEQKDNVVVYMSATAKSLFGMLRKQEYVQKDRIYQLDADYSYVDRVYFYDRKKLQKVINEILKKSNHEKAVVFINSEDTMLEMYDIYKDEANYFCSESADKLKHIREENCIASNDDIITFSKRILFTTTALDNGVDLKDEKIRYIVSEVFEPDSTIQCIGRKRAIDENDICTFFIANYEKAYTSSKKNSLNKELKPLKLFKFNKEEYIQKYGRNRTFHSDYIYPDYDSDGTEKLNMYGFYQMLLKDLDMTGMLNHGYAESMIKFNMNKELAGKVKMLTKSKSLNQELIDYLNSILGMPLHKLQQDDLKEKVKNAGLKAKTYGYNSLNNLLIVHGYKFKIVTERIHKDGKQPTVWIVERI
jgi:hypothetical protein